MKKFSYKYLYFVTLCSVLPNPTLRGILTYKGNQSEAARPPPEGNKKALLVIERRVITMYITLADLIQFCLLLVTLVIVCHTIFKDKEA